MDDILFQQDGATCHTAKVTIDLLHTLSENRIIRRNSDVNWPPRSCDLTPLDCFLWRAVKDMCCANHPDFLWKRFRDINVRNFFSIFIVVSTFLSIFRILNFLPKIEVENLHIVLGRIEIANISQFFHLNKIARI